MAERIGGEELIDGLLNDRFRTHTLHPEDSNIASFVLQASQRHEDDVDWLRSKLLAEEADSIIRAYLAKRDQLQSLGDMGIPQVVGVSSTVGAGPRSTKSKVATLSLLLDDNTSLDMSCGLLQLETLLATIHDAQQEATRVLTGLKSAHVEGS